MAKTSSRRPAAKRARTGKGVSKRRQSAVTAKEAGSGRRPLLVAVGSSAGGLEATSRLLAELPQHANLALVVVQHLQPDHASQLARLLQKRTSWPVADVEDGVEPMASRIYVVPAGKRVRLERGRLRLSAIVPHAADAHFPIDFFMRSLAEERGSEAVGVVLSGTSTDGTQGLLAIKRMGGICIAQSEVSAEFAGMPHSAAASGSVDLVLAPGEIAFELARLAGQAPSRAVARRAPAAAALSPQRAYGMILETIRSQLGVDFSRYRSSTIQRRLARRMEACTGGNISDYARYLQSHPQEVAALFQEMLIPTTRFFRDAEVFEYLATRVLPEMLRQRRPSNRPLRLWSVGCSTGEEAYSLAIIGLEALAAQGQNGGAVQVFGTDLNEAAIRRARNGRYGSDIGQYVSEARLRRYFEPMDRGYRVSKSLRDVCIFAQHDLLRDAPFSHLDVIACRNLMIYMEADLQRRIFPILHYALEPSGVLVLGSAETAGSFAELFRPLGTSAAHRKLKIFRKHGGSQMPQFDLSSHILGQALPNLELPARPRSVAEDARREADQIILSRFTPPGVVVDADLDVVEFRGSTSQFLEPAPGAASLNLMKLARGNLGAVVRTAVSEVVKSASPLRRKFMVSLGENESEPAAMVLHVLPLANPGRDNRSRTLFLVLFQAAEPAPAAPAPAGGRTGRSAASTREIATLRRNLADSQALIGSLSEEYQASKQEQQAAAEEIASANEELQSSNEELETSKEELQSANEEISTINEELRQRNAELHQSNSDLEGLIGVAEFAFVLLDRDLRIRRFSPAAEKLFHFIPTDIGRRITDIQDNSILRDIETLALQAYVSGTRQRRETRDAKGRWFELRLHPYRDAENKMDGVVLAIENIDNFKQLTVAWARQIIRGASNPIVLMNHELMIIESNAAFRRLVPGVPEGENASWRPAGLEQRVGLLASEASVDFEAVIGGAQHRVHVQRLSASEPEMMLLVTLD